jgi:hypothetical protein
MDFHDIYPIHDVRNAFVIWITKALRLLQLMK